MGLSRLQRDFVLVSSYEAVKEVLITRGKTFGGRLVTPNSRIVGREYGVNGMPEPNEMWSILRKICHQHLKQYGQGVSVIEHKIKMVAEDMFDTFTGMTGKPYNPHGDIAKAAGSAMIFILTGCRPTEDDAELQTMLVDHMHMALRCLTSNQTWTFIFLDMFPWLRIFRPSSWKELMEFNRKEEILWQTLKDRALANPDTNSLAKLFTEKEAQGETEDRHGRESATGMIVGGIVTTAETYYALLNFLAHHQDCQQRIYEELAKVTGDQNRDINLEDRDLTPYTRAFILEVMRYFPTAPLSLAHACVTTSTIAGHRVEKGTEVLINVWALHHDPDFWKDPDVFHPERFLDDEGNLLQVDHPNRRHVMPFGAGPRVCVGEVLAITRLYLWTSSFVQRFHVVPAEDNTEDLINYDNFSMKGSSLLVPQYQVKMYPR